MHSKVYWNQRSDRYVTCKDVYFIQFHTCAVVLVDFVCVCVCVSEGQMVDPCTRVHSE